jgi:hypothetical protein
MPIGTEKKTYPVFVPDVKKPVPFAYAGVAAVGGTEAYRFVANIPPTQNGTQTLPGSLVNQSASSVTLPQFFQAQITYWIDPVTGALLNVTENEKLTLRDSTGAQALLLFDANLVATTDSVDRLVALDNSQLSKMSLVGTLLPLLAGIVGLILLVVGILVGRRPRQDVEAAPSARSPELAAAESEEEAGRSTADASLVPGIDDEPGEAAPAEPAQAEAAQPEKAKAEAAEPEATQAEAAKPEAAEDETAQTGEPAESAKAEAAAESNAETEADAKEEAKAEVSQDEASTAEIPAATTAEQAEPAGAPAGDASAAKPRRGGAHRR